MTARHLAPLDKALATFERVIAASPADETELVWFQRQHKAVSHGEHLPPTPHQKEHGLENGDGEGCPRLTVLIRVVEGGRVGWHRTDSSHEPFLHNGLRQAMALAKVQHKAKQLPLLPKESESTESEIPLFDPALEKLQLDDARQRLQAWCGDDSGFLHWSQTRIAVANSHGVRRSAKTTEVSLTTACGSGPGAGLSSASARRLEDLAPERVIARARRLHSDGPIELAPQGRLPVVLAPEAVVELLNVLNTFAFSGRAYLDGSSFLSKHRGVQVFDRTVHVRDNALRVPGMPFPFDLEGTTKAPVDLIAKGQPSTPALSRAQGSEVGLRPTAQSVGGQDSMFGNLFLLPGAASNEELLKSSDGGIWIGWLEPPECHEPQRMEIRTVARGVRRIVDGELGPPVEDLIWEAGLLAALGRLQGIGNHSVVRAMPTTPLGGIAAPAMALTEVDGFRALPSD